MSEHVAREAEGIVKASEYGGREPTANWQRWLLVIIAVAWSLFQLYASYFGTLNPQKIGSIHLAFGFALAFLANIATRNGKRKRETETRLRFLHL